MINSQIIISNTISYAFNTINYTSNQISLVSSELLCILAHFITLLQPKSSLFGLPQSLKNTFIHRKSFSTRWHGKYAPNIIISVSKRIFVCFNDFFWKTTFSERWVSKEHIYTFCQTYNFRKWGGRGWVRVKPEQQDHKVKKRHFRQVLVLVSILFQFLVR